MCKCAYLFILFISPYLLFLTDYLSLLSLLFYFDIAFTHFVEKNEDSKYRKFRKREFRNKAQNQNKKRSKQK